jgi:hypothetical protein
MCTRIYVDVDVDVDVTGTHHEKLGLIHKVHYSTVQYSTVHYTKVQQRVNDVSGCCTTTVSTFAQVQVHRGKNTKESHKKKKRNDIEGRENKVSNVQRGKEAV